MATYGNPGKNPFQVTGVGGILSSVVNSDTGVTQVYRQGAFNRFQSLGTYNPDTKKFTADPNANLTAAERKSLSNEKGISTIVTAAETTSKKAQIENGVAPAVADAKTKELLKTGKAKAAPGADPQQGATSTATNDDIAKLLKTYEKGTREKYDVSLVYPIGLQLEHQDCIKFSVVKYQASGLDLDAAAKRGRRVTLTGNIPGIESSNNETERAILTTITLPIPGGISDTNGVDWQSGSLDEVTRALANVAQSTISGGGDEGAATAGKELNNVQQNAPQFKAATASKFTEAAIGKDANILQRQFGAIINPNMELLFNGPSLRTFSFTFKLSPRSESEAIVVKKIIRYFKQAMTPKRTKGSLLLQSPHTFAISYLSSNKQHPYLNKFKECALTSCSVNYTPDGNYMTFMGPEPSMTSYDLTLQFQELVPLFDDDYGLDDTNIGF